MVFVTSRYSHLQPSFVVDEEDDDEEEDDDTEDDHSAHSLSLRARSARSVVLAVLFYAF